ncbi:ribosomal protein S18-alanine N-acetyltransferase [Amnibacterium sp. CER49]|uniref:ribosomal protein S18-alanine N-acetyltransferase n=1 Tax=Amnibacterium sp. CER49 TaxID=3039161 RepID=UPI00244BFD63|nr:ribosomal protein S18-alanine N-acetyltransferase [Amnibacterium sp. CER49]MDH2443943.1 ribosomal protein S18-alanine N-acetyltransferase [Amnibacterium sp. CER49]
MTAAVRPARPGDLAAIMTIERASFPTDAWSERAMRETLDGPDAVALAAEDDGRLVGYGAVLAPRGAADADVLTLAVAQADRGAGTGRALLEGLLEAAGERGARTVFLEVRADNAVAQRLYTTRGFVGVGRRPHYYQPDDVDAVVMRLDLTPGGAA